MCMSLFYSNNSDIRLGPFVQSIVSLTKWSVKYSLSLSSTYKIRCANSFVEKCEELRQTFSSKKAAFLHTFQKVNW